MLIKYTTADLIYLTLSKTSQSCFVAAAGTDNVLLWDLASNGCVKNESVKSSFCY